MHPKSTLAMGGCIKNAHFFTIGDATHRQLIRASTGIDDLLGGLDIGPSPASTPPPPMPVLLTDPTKGVTVTGRVIRHQGGIGYHLAISNSGSGPLDGFMFQTNRNSFGLSPTNQVVGIPTLSPGASGHTVIPLTSDPNKIVQGTGAAFTALQVALKTNQQGVLYFNDNVPLAALLEESGTIDGATFLSNWKALPPEQQQRLPNVLVTSMDTAKAKLQASSLFVLAHRPVPGSAQEALYLTGRVTGPAGGQIMLELRIVPGQQGVDASFKSEKSELAPMAFEAVATVLA